MSRKYKMNLMNCNQRIIKRENLVEELNRCIPGFEVEEAQMKVRKEDIQLNTIEDRF